MVNLQKQYESLVSNVQAGFIAPNDAFVTLASMTAIDADGFIWSIDINGEFRRSDNNQAPSITDPSLFASLENVHYKVNNQRPIEEVNYDLPPSNFTYRDNSVDYPEPELDVAPRFSPSKSNKKLTRLPQLNFLSNLSLSKVRTPFIVVVCLLVVIVAIGGSKKDKTIKLGDNVPSASPSNQPEPTKTELPSKSKVKENHQVTLTTSSIYTANSTKIDNLILLGKINTSEIIDKRLLYSLVYLNKLGYNSKFTAPNCEKSSCLFVVKMSNKTEVYNFNLIVNYTGKIWTLKEIK